MATQTIELTPVLKGRITRVKNNGGKGYGKLFLEVRERIQGALGCPRQQAKHATRKFLKEMGL